MEENTDKKKPIWKTLLVAFACLCVAAAGVYTGNDVLTKAGVEGSTVTLIQDEVVKADSVEKAATCIDVVIGLRSAEEAEIKASVCKLSDVAANTDALKDTLSVILKDDPGATALVTSIVRQLNAKYTPGEGEERVRAVLKLIAEALHSAVKSV